jgi:hypothetical protein
MLNQVQATEAVAENTVEAAPVRTLSSLDDLYVPQSHEERLEWVRKSCERFFEKIREFETLVNLFEPNQA